jgi:Ca2+-binding RTX toxin-like protein
VAQHGALGARGEKMKRIVIMALAIGLICALGAGVALAKNITGNNKNNTLVGTKNADTIKGKGGKDYIYGLQDNDKLFGNDGDDNIDGGKGNDDLHGNADNDFLDSVDGSNKDTDDCGSGKDAVAADKGDKISNDCETVKKFSL